MTLSPQQRKLYDFMLNAGIEVDIAIITLHFKLDVRPRMPDRIRTNKHKTYTGREMQQMVGSAASRTNRKIKEFGHAIVPGDLKHTYRLTTIKS